MAEPFKIDPKLVTLVARRSPQAAAIGLKVLSMDGDSTVMEVPWREDLVGDAQEGVIAGGVVTTLLDHVCGFSVNASGATLSTATLDLRIDYLRAAAPRAGVIAQATCYKQTRTIAFVRGVAYDVSPDDPIAMAQAAFVLQGAG